MNQIRFGFMETRDYKVLYFFCDYLTQQLFQDALLVRFFKKLHLKKLENLLSYIFVGKFSEQEPDKSYPIL